LQAFTSSPLGAPSSPSPSAAEGEGGVTKNLPLASLLPKVKSITARLIPEDLGRNPQSLLQIKSLSAGPQVSSLCSRVFISATKEPSPLVGSPSGNRALPSSSGAGAGRRHESPIPQRKAQSPPPPQIGRR
jgi:hypothetical protein